MLTGPDAPQAPTVIIARADPGTGRVGQIRTLTMAAGPTRVRVIGIDTGQTNSGDTVYFPLPALERLDGGPGTADSMWLASATLAAVLVLTLLVIRVPLRRATRIQPGTALRYQ